jgi:P27 family predicted phage terminase small subunit
MGARGPVPAPTKVKLARGDRSSRINFREPLPATGLPAMPADMDDEAKAVWRRVVKVMGPTGTIKLSDADALRCYCEAVSRYAVAARLYAQSGPLVKTRNGITKNQLHQIVRENADQVRLFARELGLTPSARSGLHVEPEHAADSVFADLGLPARLRVVGDGR